MIVLNVNESINLLVYRYELRKIFYFFRIVINPQPGMYRE